LHFLQNRTSTEPAEMRGSTLAPDDLLVRKELHHKHLRNTPKRSRDDHQDRGMKVAMFRRAPGVWIQDETSGGASGA